MDPSTGTFTSMDTYGGSLSDPMSLHKYMFVNSNPIMNSDPSGHFTLTECQKSMLIGATLSSISYSAIWGIASLIDAHSGTNYSAGFSLTGLICSMIYGALLGGLGWEFSIAFKALHLTFMQYIGLSVFCILIGLDLKVWSYFEGKSGDVIWSAILGTLGDTSYVAGGAAVGAAVNARNNPLGLHNYGGSNTGETSASRTIGDDNKTKVYRVLRNDENPSNGLTAKNPNSKMSVEGHVVNGSRHNGSQYISTTTDIYVAKQWAAKTGGTIVEIDLNMLPPDAGIYDLSTDFGRSIYLKGFTANNYAKSSSEVLIKGFIPSKAVKVVN